MDGFEAAETDSERRQLCRRASKGGLDRESQTVVATDILIQQKGRGGEHVYLGFDEYLARPAPIVAVG